MSLPFDVPPSLPAAAAAPEGAPRRRGRRFLVASLVTLGCIATGGVFLTSWLLERDERPGEWRIAQDFVGWLKLGEEQRPGAAPDDPMGYARAWDLFSTELKQRLDFESFYQEMLLLTRRYGPIVAGDALRRQGRDRSARREFVYQLRLGDPSASAEELAEFLLVLTMAREGGECRVSSYQFLPAESVKR